MLSISLKVIHSALLSLSKYEGFFFHILLLRVPLCRKLNIFTTVQNIVYAWCCLFFIIINDAVFFSEMHFVFDSTLQEQSSPTW